RRELEHCTVQPLVEQAVPVAVEPQHLQPRGSTVGEHEPRATLRLLTELRFHQVRQAIEPLTHVERLGAHEDANAGRDHDASKTCSNRRNAAASKSDGTLSLTLPRSSSSKPSRALGVPVSSTKPGDASLLGSLCGEPFAPPACGLRPRLRTAAFCSRVSAHFQ